MTQIEALTLQLRIAAVPHALEIGDLLAVGRVDGIRDAFSAPETVVSTRTPVPFGLIETIVR